MKDKKKVKPSHSLSVGDAVWIVRAAYTGWFFRGFTESNSEELFVIKTIETSEGNVPVYHLEDLGKESRRIRADLPEFFPIKIIRRRINPKDKRKQGFVRWLGYPESFNSWVEEEDIA